MTTIVMIMAAVKVAGCANPLFAQSYLGGEKREGPEPVVG
jgi:hypothetical protein